MNLSRPPLVADIETNGLYDEVDRVHVLCIRDMETGERRTYRRNADEDTIEYGLLWLQDCAGQGRTIAFHNGIKYDYPVLQKLFPWFAIPRESVFDTLVFTRLKWPDLKSSDHAIAKTGRLPGKLIGKHTLESWGYRLGKMKGEYEGDPRIEDPKERAARKWEAWNPEMESYCEQDVEVTAEIITVLKPAEYSPVAIILEHRAAWLMAQQERNGFHFNEQGAGELYALLTQKRLELEAQLKETFGSWEVPQPDFIPKRDNKKLGYKAGVPVKRSKVIEFNPSSRQHIGDRLQKLYGWKPDEFGKDGYPTIDDEVMSQLDYPPCRLLSEYLLVDKRIGQIAEGKQAWLRHVKKGVIHGGINPNGAVTGRATHMFPNIAQVPKVGTQYGAECRALFIVPVGWILMGADQAGLELRTLGHYMAKFDGGAYAEAVVNGNSDDETDVHSLNCKALGMEPKKLYSVNGKTSTGRNIAKTFIYAFLYGAGDEKLGKILGVSKAAARKIKANFLKALPALAQLKDDVAKAASRGWLKGLDGRRIPVRSAHAALNTLLQSAGAIVCKQWIVMVEEKLQALGLKHGFDGDYAFCAWVHDEIQVACRTSSIAATVSQVAVQAAIESGIHFNLKCPLGGEAKTGNTWKDTH